MSGAAPEPALPAVFSARHGDVVVRSADAADFDEVARLLSFLVADDPDPEPVARAPFERALASRQRLILVATRDGATVGTLDVVVVDNPTHRGAPWAAIENVVVAPEARRRRVGTALVQSAVEVATAAGCYKVQLLSGARRADAHGLYEATGFDAPVRGFRRYL